MASKSKRPKDRSVPGARLAAGAAKELAAVEWIRSHSRILFILLVLAATARILATYPIFNHTIDEPAHIACGMEWLSKGVYHYEDQHPPLARVSAALGMYLAGVRTFGVTGIYQEGEELLYRGGHYDRNLALARMGILPFFWIACLVVYLWARRCCGEPAAIFAVFLFTFLPPVLAHAGLATTDMALTAFVGASFFSGLLWLDRPDLRRSILLGASTGLAILSKFGVLPFLPAAITAAVFWRWVTDRPRFGGVPAAVRARLVPSVVAVATGCLVIWGGYRFSFGSSPALRMRMPVPELFAGIQTMLQHNRNGHPAYLLGQRSNFGWWYYYLVVLAVKTPLPFLALLASGAVACVRGKQNRELRCALAFSAGILGVSLFSNINIGVRHILPVYLGFSIVAAAGAVRLLELSGRSRPALGTFAVLGLWMLLTSAASHPDYLPYFNALAGTEPEKILVDSDLDWGQDMKRLGRRLNEVGATELRFNPLIVAYLEAAHGFPPTYFLDPEKPAPGWNAVSLTVLKALRLGLNKEHPEIKLWPDYTPPTERVGKGVLLYYFPPNAQP